MNHSAFIYIAGADGTGKTTRAQLLIEYLQSEGVRCKHVRLRFPFFLSLPLLAYARWRGFSWYEVCNGTQHGYWDFGGSRLMRSVFPWMFLLDASLAGLVHVHLPLWLGATVVCERFVLDMIVDLTVALDDPAFHRRHPGAVFRRMLPRRSRIVILDLDADLVRQRRPELRTDRALEARLKAYRRLAADLSLTQSSSAGPLDRVSSQIDALIGEGG